MNGLIEKPVYAIFPPICISVGSSFEQAYQYLREDSSWHSWKRNLTPRWSPIAPPPIYIGLEWPPQSSGFNSYDFLSCVNWKNIMFPNNFRTHADLRPTIEIEIFNFCKKRSHRISHIFHIYFQYCIVVE